MSAITNFLKAWSPGGPWSVGAISPMTDGTMHQWRTTDDLDEVDEFVERNQARGWNCYFQPNVCREDAGPDRISREDVVYAWSVFAEVDPPDSITTPAQLRAWQDDSRPQFMDEAYWVGVGVPRPTVVIFSGSGFAMLWQLSEPRSLWVERDGEWAFDAGAALDIERRNKWFTAAIGADPAATDVSRLLRLPHTINYPSPSKAKRGRVGPVESDVILWAGPCDFDAMPAVAPRAASPSSRALPEFAGRPDDDQLALAVAALSEAWPGVGSRHATRRALAGALAHANWPEDAIVDLVTQMPTDDPAIAERDARDFAARSIRMVADGEACEGWPTLEQRLQGDAAAAIRAARAALGLPAGLTLDPAGADRWAALAERAKPAPAPPPTQLEDDAAILATVNRLSRARSPDDRADAERLRRASRGQFLVDDPSEDARVALMRAAMAVGRALPPGPDMRPRIARQLVTSAGALAPDLDEIAMVVVEALDEERRQTAATEFETYPTGPQQGQPLPNSQGNFDIACANLGVTLRYDKFARQILIRAGTDLPEEVYQDIHVTQLRLRIDREFRFKPELRELREMITDRAFANAFHPVLDFFEGLPDHDGTERVRGANRPSWLTTYLGVRDTAFVRAIGRMVMVALVRRVRRPGCKFDEMLVIEGIQGSFKSTTLATLCPRPEWFADNFDLSWDSQRLLEHTRGKLVIEVPEMQGRTQADRDRLKAQLSRQIDTARKAYGHEPETVARQFVFFATVNDEVYLTDPTGNRRYLPVRAGDIDIAGLARDREQLWAEACMLEAQNPTGDYIRLDPSLYEDAAAEQAARRVDDPHVVRLSKHLADATGSVQLEDVWRLLGFHEEKNPTRGESNGISQALQSLGWTRSRDKTIGGVRATWYGRGTQAEREVPLRVSGSVVQGYKVEVASTPQVVAKSTQYLTGLN